MSLLTVLIGFIWITGNINSVAVIKLIGIGLGSLFWNASGLLIGWAFARFGKNATWTRKSRLNYLRASFPILPGWFGAAQIPSDQTINYIGIFIGVISTIVLVFLKPQSRISAEKEPLLPKESPASINGPAPPLDIVSRAISRMSERVKLIVGSLLALFVGASTTLAYAPLISIMSHDPTASLNNMDYTFSMSTGIFLGMLLYFVIYCLLTRNNPQVYPKVR